MFKLVMLCLCGLEFNVLCQGANPASCALYTTAEHKARWVSTLQPWNP